MPVSQTPVSGARLECLPPGIIMKTFAPFRFVLRLNKSDYMSSRSDSPPTDFDKWGGRHRAATPPGALSESHSGTADTPSGQKAYGSGSGVVRGENDDW